MSSYILYYNLNPTYPKVETLPYRVATDAGVLGGLYLFLDSSRRIQHLPGTRFTPLGRKLITNFYVKELLAEGQAYFALTYDGELYCQGRSELWENRLSGFTLSSQFKDMKISQIFVSRYSSSQSNHYGYVNWVRESVEALVITDKNEAIIWTEHKCEVDAKLSENLKGIMIKKVVISDKYTFLTGKHYSCTNIKIEENYSYTTKLTQRGKSKSVNLQKISFMRITATVSQLQ